MEHTVDTVTPLPIDCGVHEQILDYAHAGHRTLDTTTFADSSNTAHAYCEDCRELYARAVWRTLEPPTT